MASAPTDTSPPAERAMAPAVAPDPEAPAPQQPAPAARACGKCGAPLASGQDWCLQCGAGAPGSLEHTARGWRSTGAVIAICALLVLGAAAAAYAALTKGRPRPRVVRALVAQAAPAATPPASAPATTPAAPATATATTPKVPLTGKVATPPKIPISPVKLPKVSSPATAPGASAPTTSTPTKTTPAANAPSSGSSGPEPIELDTDAAATYNPYAYPASEFGDPSLATDGDTSTAWTAQVNPATAPKMAEGLTIDLKTPTRVGAVVLVTSTPGMTIQLYGAHGQTPPSSITDPGWVKLSPSIVEHKHRLRIKLKHAKTAFTFIALWISQAGASSQGTAQAPGHVSVNELELFPPA